MRKSSFDHHLEEMLDMLAKIDVMTAARFVLLDGRQLPQWDRDCIVEGAEGGSRRRGERLFHNAQHSDYWFKQIPLVEVLSPN